MKLVVIWIWDFRERTVVNLDNQKDGGEKMYIRVGIDDVEEVGFFLVIIKFDV